jgi:hypothetical protein
MEAVFGMPRLGTGLALSALLLCLGCGGPKGDVSGKVTWRSKPLPAGTVTFFGPEDRVIGNSQISADGEYTIPKVPAGPVRITVTVPPSVRDPSAPPPSKGGKKKGKDLTEERRSIIRLDVPAKYRMPDQSGLTYTVQPGPQEHNIDLQ